MKMRCYPALLSVGNLNVAMLSDVGEVLTKILAGEEESASGASEKRASR